MDNTNGALGVVARSMSPSPARTAVESADEAPRLKRLPRDKTALQRVLPGWQILMIATGGVIGITVFSTNGEILNTAGPIGLLIALIFVAITTICVMECIGEFVIQWPVSNAMFEYVKAFVDRDLAIVVGLAYWYTMSCVFATLIIVAADFSTYWIHQEVWRVGIFYAGTPLALLLINCAGVWWYGWVEGIGGIIKLLMVLSGIIYMICESPKAGSANITDDFKHWSREANNDLTAICISIPLISYAFIGTEIVSVTAFEAKVDRKRNDPSRALRLPARSVAYIISGIYFLCALLEAILVAWNNKNLPQLEDHPGTSSKVRRDQAGYKTTPGFYAVIVIAARLYSSEAVGWYFNACIIYFCLSAANTALYVASRAAFGLCRGIHRMDHVPWYLKLPRYIGTTSPIVEVPHWALLASTVAFFWLPYLELKRGYSITDLLVIMSTTASIGGILVWASQCLAYIRYYHWFHSFKEKENLPDEYNRWEPRNGYRWLHSRMLMASWQPVPAYIGLVFCFLIVFILSTATWWNGNITFKKVATAYAGPLILTCIFVALKFWRYLKGDSPWVILGPDRSQLTGVINDFEKNCRLIFDGAGDVEMTNQAHHGAAAENHLQNHGNDPSTQVL